jgi:hypothetical protein
MDGSIGKTTFPFRIAGTCAVCFVGAIAGCANVLGIEELQTNALSASAADGGADQFVPPTQIVCSKDEECTASLPPLDRSNCAIAKCASSTKLCAFLAKDEDGDGLTAQCVSKDPARPVVQSANIDCDDTNAGIVAGSEIDCTDGTFTLPGKGECRAGKKRCKPDGNFDACIGATGKKPETCDVKDHDCDGTVDNGCTCSPGTSRKCGPPQAGNGICKEGTQRCENATWAACVDAVFPAARNCQSATDNDCNGIPDNAEAGCKCDATVSAGTTRACTSTLPGICATGSQTCNVSTTAAAWSTCAGAPAQAKNCNSAADNDCNGTADNAEIICKCDGVTAPGTARACTSGQAGICSPGTQACATAGASAAWGTCAPNSAPQAKNCNSAADNDCNGTADNAESACSKCDGVTAPGTMRACATGLAGICSPGTQVCNVGAGAATWGVCTQTTAATSRSCASAADNDCNSLVDNTETLCKCGSLMVGDTKACLIVRGEPGIQTCVSLGATAALDACQ